MSDRREAERMKRIVTIIIATVWLIVFGCAGHDEWRTAQREWRESVHGDPNDSTTWDPEDLYPDSVLYPENDEGIDEGSNW